MLSSLPGASPSGDPEDGDGDDEDDEDDEDVGSDFDEEEEEKAAFDDDIGYYNPNEDGEEGGESEGLEDDPVVAPEDVPPKAGFSGQKTLLAFTNESK